MEYRILGKTGLKISRMGFGGIPIQRIDAEGTKALMHKLLENGVNYIDTARGYTVSEEYLGIGLEGHPGAFRACHQEHVPHGGGHGEGHRYQPEKPPHRLY